MKYYLIAGEASGDLHGSNLIKALHQLDADAQMRCWGGQLMQAAGADLVKHYKDLAFMGFVEVIKNLRTILHNIQFCKQNILDYKPDALILIDYPGFNLRIADWAKKQKMPVFYYISPQIWAWHTSRVHKIKQIVDKMFVILPFEKDFYQKYDYQVDFVGHPLLDMIDKYQKMPNWLQKKDLNHQQIVALLPGSRKQEILSVLPQMLSIVSDFPTCQFVIAGAPSQSIRLYQSVLAKSGFKVDAIPIIQNDTYALLQHATAALVTSGTATLETALFNVPQVVCYKGGAISFAIAKRLVKLKYISLVNLIMEKEIVKELIQKDLNYQNLRDALETILKNRDKIQSEYLLLKQKLGNEGASQRTAKLILEWFKSSQNLE
jgi:lipid-A-disaccharide synthase